MLNCAASFKLIKVWENKSFGSLDHLLLVLPQCIGFLKTRKQYNEIFFFFTILQE